MPTLKGTEILWFSVQDTLVFFLLHSRHFEECKLLCNNKAGSPAVSRVLWENVHKSENLRVTVTLAKTRFLGLKLWSFTREVRKLE